MSSHVFHEIYLHLNWHTKNDRPLLTPECESAVYQFLHRRCCQTKGVYFHGIGGIDTHVHLAINIEPFVCISDLVGDLKGACSFEMNKQKGQKVLEWQRGFGVVSFGKKQLAWVLRYIAHQKEHHRQGTTHQRLEKTFLDDDGSPWRMEAKPRSPAEAGWGVFEVSFPPAEAGGKQGVGSKPAKNTALGTKSHGENLSR